MWNIKNKHVKIKVIKWRGWSDSYLSEMAPDISEPSILQPYKQLKQAGSGTRNDTPIRTAA